MRALFLFCCTVLLWGSCQEPSSPLNLSRNTDKIYCFENLDETWSTRLMFYFEGEQIQGIMEFSSPGLGEQRGIFEGRLYGDTLMGTLDLSTDYLTIAREVSFLLSEEGLKEGKGEMVQGEGRMVFRDKRALKYEGEMVLVPAQCDDFPGDGDFQ
jgi:hypothetical protein